MLGFGIARAKEPTEYEIQRDRLTEDIRRIDFVLGLRQKDLTHLASLIGMLEEKRREKQLQLARLVGQ